MPALLVSKSPPLRGELTVHGAKNSVLPILAATLLCRTPCVLHNCPDILDVTHALSMLRSLGCTYERRGASIYIDTRSCAGGRIPPELAGTMRASSLFLGALLARTGEAELSLPGGCPIGERPMDYHLQAFRTLGAEVRQTERTVFCKASRLTGARLRLPGPSVGATENAMLAAIGAAGETTIENAAREPEITDLAGFLCACGAKITGAGTSRIRISGGEPLTGATYTVLPDRIETATFLCACAACGGTLTLRRAAPQLLQPVLDALRQSGCQISCGSDTITVCRHGRLTACLPVVSERQDHAVSRLPDRRDAGPSGVAAAGGRGDSLHGDHFRKPFSPCAAAAEARRGAFPAGTHRPAAGRSLAPCRAAAGGRSARRRRAGDRRDVRRGGKCHFWSKTYRTGI